MRFNRIEVPMFVFDGMTKLLLGIERQVQIIMIVCILVSLALVCFSFSLVAVHMKLSRILKTLEEDDEASDKGNPFDDDYFNRP